MNLCEVYYQSVRQSNATLAAATIASLYTDGVIERRDMSRRFWQLVGNHKARGGISLPDCFCISLAQELSAEVVTSDHGEFDPLVPLGIVPILLSDKIDHKQAAGLTMPTRYRAFPLLSRAGYNNRHGDSLSRKDTGDSLC